MSKQKSKKTITHSQNSSIISIQTCINQGLNWMLKNFPLTGFGTKTSIKKKFFGITTHLRPTRSYFNHIRDWIIAIGIIALLDAYTFMRPIFEWEYGSYSHCHLYCRGYIGIGCSWWRWDCWRWFEKKCNDYTSIMIVLASTKQTYTVVFILLLFIFPTIKNENKWYNIIVNKLFNDLALV